VLTILLIVNVQPHSTISPVHMPLKKFHSKIQVKYFVHNVLKERKIFIVVYQLNLKTIIEDEC